MKKVVAAVLTLMIAVAFVGCASTPEESRKSVPASKENEKTKAKAEVKKEEKREEKKKEKQEEVNANDTSKDTKKVVVYSAGPKSLSSAIKEKFEAETGLTMELFQSTTGKILGKLEAEKENPVADVIVLASWPAALNLKEQGMTRSYVGAKNVDKLNNGWVDNDFHIFGYSGSALGITYNTTLVDEPGKDWIDFADEKWKGQVNMPDPSLSGSAMDFISGYAGDKGWDLFEALKANDVEVAGANKAALEPVITGSKSAVLAGVDYMAYSNKAKGEPVDIVYPSSGTVVNPRAVLILKDAKNIENAQILIDYMLSDEAQQLVMDAYILPGRSDLKCTNRVNLEDIPMLNYDWADMQQKQADNNKKFLEIFK